MPSNKNVFSFPLVFWMVAVVTAYVSGTWRWLYPEYLRWGLPFFQSFPGITVFPMRMAGLAGGLASLYLAGYSAGGLAGSFLRLGPGAVVGRIAVGWITLGAMILALGLSGLWWKPLLMGVLVAFALAGIPGLKARIGRFTLPFPGFLSFPGFLLPVSLAGWVVLLLCLSPEAFQDPLRYHLFLPGQFLVVHKIYFYGNFFFWSYMGPVHMLYSAGLAVAGTSGAKAVNLACAILSLLVLDRIAGRIGLGKPERAVLQSITITAPGWVFVTGSAFVEQAGVLYILLAMDALLDRAHSRVSRIRGLFLFMGMAASVKYTSIFGGVGLLMMLVFSGEAELWVGSLKKRWLAPAGLLLAPFLPWAAARWLWTGDPISPLLARLGITTMDTPSLVQLSAAYDFAQRGLEKAIANPVAVFSGLKNVSGPGGFWENPGPAIICLLPAVAVAWKSIPALGGSLLWFFTGSVGFWLIFFGGVSPHYIVAYGGAWIAVLLVPVNALASPVRTITLNILTFTAFYQALIALSSLTAWFFPRDVAFGVQPPEQYLDVAIVSKRVYRPVRRAVEERLPGRGVVYSFGDDKGFYLAGRVALDYDFGSDPLLWKLAAESRNPLELRKRVRQRGWTHMIYATYWVDYYGGKNSLVYRHDSRVLGLMQDFWREYAELAIRLEIREEGRVKGSYVYSFRKHPSKAPYDMDGRERLPFLPGAEALFLGGDSLLLGGQTGDAAAFYAGHLARFPDSTILHERLGRLAVYFGRISEARSHVNALESRGWLSPSLRRLAWGSNAGAGRENPRRP